MKFNEYFEKLYRYYGAGQNEYEFFKKILSSLCLVQEDKIFNEDDTEIGKYILGRRPIPKSSARYIIRNIDKPNLVSYLKELSESITVDSLVLLCNEFETVIINASIDNINTKLVDLLVEIIKEFTAKNSNQNKNAKTATVYQSEQEIENEIRNIISSLAKMPETEINYTLSNIPLRIEKKIKPNNVLLKKDITDDVLGYYRYIEKLFSDCSNEKSNLFDNFAKEVKKVCDDYLYQDFSQETVFSCMTDWLMKKVSSPNRTACKIIISFFVQNCEVFHEIA